MDNSVAGSSINDNVDARSSLSTNPNHRCTPSLFLYSNGCEENARRAAAGLTCRRCRYDFQEGFRDRDGKIYKYLRLDNLTLDTWFEMADRYREVKSLSVKDVNLIMNELIWNDRPALDVYSTDYEEEKRDNDDYDDCYEEDEEEETDDERRDDIQEEEEYLVLRKRLRRFPKLRSIYQRDINIAERKRFVRELVRLTPILLKLDSAVKSRLLRRDLFELEKIFENHRIIDFDFNYSDSDDKRHGSLLVDKNDEASDETVGDEGTSINSSVTSSTPTVTSESNSSKSSFGRWIKIPVIATSIALRVNDTRLDNLFYSADYYHSRGYLELEMAVNVFLQTTRRVTQSTALSKIKVSRNLFNYRLLPLKACLFKQLIDVSGANYENVSTNPSRLHCESLSRLWRAIGLSEFMLDLKQIVVMLNDIRFNHGCVRDLGIIVFDRLSDVTEIDEETNSEINRMFRRLCSSDFSLTYLIFPFSFYVDKNLLVKSCSYLIARVAKEICTRERDIKFSTLVRLLDTVNTMTALRGVECLSRKIDDRFFARVRNETFRRSVKLDANHPFVKDFDRLQKPVLEYAINSLTDRRCIVSGLPTDSSSSFMALMNFASRTSSSTMTSNAYERSSIFSKSNSVTGITDNDNLYEAKKKFDNDTDARNYAGNVEDLYSMPKTYPIDRKSILDLLEERYEFSSRITRFVRDEICRANTLKPWVNERECDNITVLRFKMETRNSENSEAKAYARRILWNVWANNGVRLNLARSKEFATLMKSLILRCKTL